MGAGKGKQDSKYAPAKAQGYSKQQSETIGMKQGQMLRANDDISQDKFLGTLNKGFNGK
jgi:hypothetical protein